MGVLIYYLNIRLQFTHSRINRGLHQGCKQSLWLSQRPAMHLLQQSLRPAPTYLQSNLRPAPRSLLCSTRKAPRPLLSSLVCLLTSSRTIPLRIILTPQRTSLSLVLATQRISLSLCLQPQARRSLLLATLPSLKILLHLGNTSLKASSSLQKLFRLRHLYVSGSAL